MEFSERLHRYPLYGLTVASQLELPELAPLPAASTFPPDLVFRFETFSDWPSIPSVTPPLWTIDDSVYLNIDRVARYRIRSGREVAIEPYPDASPRDVRLYLLGSAIGVICHQRGLLLLHANAIVANGCAVAFAGRRGIGKSTLAAHFQLAGYDVLSDDVCAIDLGDSGEPQVWPGLPRVKLCPDAAEHLGFENHRLEPAAECVDKRHVPLPPRVTGGPFPLTQVYVLDDLTPGQPAEMTRLTGSAAVQALMSNTYRKAYLRPMGRKRANFLQAAAVAARTQIFAAPRRRGYDRFAAEASRLERHFSDRAGAAAAL